MLNRSKHIGEEYFVFYKFAFPSIVLLILCPTAASAAICVLSNSTYKLSICTDMIIEILITKLPAKFVTESHWRWIFSRLKYVTHLNLISFLTVMESRDLVSVSRRVSRPVFLSLGLGLGLERLRSRLGLERFRSRFRVLGLEVLGLK